eukprot:COSAG02_NODE_1718_length_11207_cov_2.888999_3_plen_173_part_00
MVRALFSSYDGPLYAVQRASDNSSTNVSLLTAGGYANSKTQDLFCAGTDCVVSTVFDQTANENHLFVFGADDDYQGRQDKAANASIDPHTISGHPVYSLFTESGMGYRTVAGAAKGVAVNDDEESMYAVFGGKHYNVSALCAYKKDRLTAGFLKCSSSCASTLVSECCRNLR